MRVEATVPCHVMDLDRFGNKCTVHGWVVSKECHDSERDQVPAPPRDVPATAYHLAP